MATASSNPYLPLLGGCNNAESSSKVSPNSDIKAETKEKGFLEPSSNVVSSTIDDEESKDSNSPKSEIKVRKNFLLQNFSIRE